MTHSHTSLLQLHDHTFWVWFDHEAANLPQKHWPPVQNWCVHWHFKSLASCDVHLFKGVCSQTQRGDISPSQVGSIHFDNEWQLLCFVRMRFHCADSFCASFCTHLQWNVPFSAIVCVLSTAFVGWHLHPKRIHVFVCRAWVHCSFKVCQFLHVLHVHTVHFHLCSQRKNDSLTIAWIGEPLFWCSISCSCEFCQSLDVTFTFHQISHWFVLPFFFEQLCTLQEFLFQLCWTLCTTVIPLCAVIFTQFPKLSMLHVPHSCHEFVKHAFAVIDSLPFSWEIDHSGCFILDVQVTLCHKSHLIPDKIDLALLTMTHCNKGLFVIIWVTTWGEWDKKWFCQKDNNQQECAHQHLPIVTWRFAMIIIRVAFCWWGDKPNYGITKIRTTIRHTKNKKQKKETPINNNGCSASPSRINICNFRAMMMMMMM